MDADFQGGFDTQLDQGGFDYRWIQDPGSRNQQICIKFWWTFHILHSEQYFCDQRGFIWSKYRRGQSTAPSTERSANKIYCRYWYTHLLHLQVYPLALKSVEFEPFLHNLISTYRLMTIANGILGWCVDFFWLRTWNEWKRSEAEWVFFILSLRSYMPRRNLQWSL